jgi:aspartyl-tRNA(Asn)/glutamyl-tRNA(Gln) amidotransferase subunit C
MKIDRDEARRIADLAHLELDDAALVRMAAEMTKILTYIDQLREVDVEGFEEWRTGGPACLDEGQAGAPVLHLRDDTPQPSIDRDRVASNAPAWSDGFFVVPKVIGGE